MARRACAFDSFVQPIQLDAEVVPRRAGRWLFVREPHNDYIRVGGLKVPKAVIALGHPLDCVLSLFPLGHYMSPFQGMFSKNSRTRRKDSIAAYAFSTVSASSTSRSSSLAL